MKPNITIYQILKTWSERTPQAPSLVAPGSASLTYAQLVEKVDRIAASLRAIGVARRDRVAAVLPNGLAAAATFIAAANTASWAPLSPAYRQREYSLYLSELNPKVIIVDPKLQSAVAMLARRRDIPVLTVSMELEIGGDIAKHTPDQWFSSEYKISVEPDDPTLILSTSGTTSAPKRVPLTQASLIASAENITATLGLTPSDRCLNVMPLFHIHGLVGALLASLVAGASIVLPQTFDGTLFFDWMKAYQPTWYTAVPTVHQAILSNFKRHPKASARGKLRFIRSSSAPLATSVMQELERRFMVPVIEAYGMTEAAHQIASNPLPPRQRKPGSVGLAAGPDVAIMNEAGELLSVRESGEIVVRGANVMRGYENTISSDIPSFTKGWFRTGDRGYFDEEGYLFITGRLKEMINKGGEKISPREIEDILHQHRDIADAAAFAVPHPSLGEDVAAAVVLRRNLKNSELAIREYMYDKIAGFKVPSRIFIVDEIPKSATGKIQRIALTENFAERLKGETLAPANEFEATVARIYAEVLDVPQVSVRDNFFALGGDSLRAFQLIARIRAVFAVNLSIATIFLKPTVKDLSLEIHRGMDSPKLALRSTDS